MIGKSKKKENREASLNQRGEANIFSLLIPALIFTVGLVFSFYIYFILEKVEFIQIKSNFNSKSQDMFNSFIKELDIFMADLEAVQSFVSIVPHISREDFAQFTKPVLKRQKGIQAIEWAPRLSFSELSSYEEKARQTWLSDFKFFGKNEKDEKIALIEKESYYPLYYVEPLKGNEKAAGFDLSSNPIRLKAIEQAITSRSPAATQRITLVQEKGEMFGTLIVLPVYQTSEATHQTNSQMGSRGVVLGVMRIADLVNTSLKNIDTNLMNIYFFDKDAPEKEDFLYTKNQSDKDITLGEVNQLAASGALTQEIPIDIGGRRWLFIVQAMPAFVVYSWIPIIAFVISLLISIFIAYIVRFIFLRIRTTIMLGMLQNLVEIRTKELEIAKDEALNTLKKLKLMQSQLVQAEKMSSLGTLTAGIAHEINNPINFVMSCVKPLKSDINDLTTLIDRYQSLDFSGNVQSQLDEIEELKKNIDLEFTIEEINRLLDSINDGSTRTASIVKDLRIFSRLDEMDMKKANIHEGIDSTLLLLQKKHKNTVQIKKEYGEIPEVDCHPGEINQVFMNILLNAFQAIKENGLVTIKTEVKTKDVKIHIIDNGEGMDETTRKRIFEPFFTTRDVGKGTGLGLSISLSIINAHHGSIDVRSHVGKGSEFIITLPIVQP